MLKIVLATSNPHKIEEINSVSVPFGIEFVLPDEGFNPIEDGSTFEENSYAKALAAAQCEMGERKYFMADDSGLCVDALNGAPGIYSARYAPSAKERINKLLNVMKDKENRSAKFVCAMVLVNKNADILFQTQQECHGSILKEEKGQNGFGYDPIFYVTSQGQGMAELSDVQKSKVSHRAKALNKVLEWIKNEYSKNQDK